MGVLGWFITIGGGALIVLGFVVLRAAKTRLLEGAGHQPLLGGLPVSAPTRTAVGVCCLIVGYHGLAYGPLARFDPLRIPPGFLWLLIAGPVVLIGLALSADVVERRRGLVPGDDEAEG